MLDLLVTESRHKRMITPFIIRINRNGEKWFGYKLERRGKGTTVTTTLRLSFQDFAKLAANGSLVKDGVTIAFDRPVLSEVTVNPGKGGKALFYLDETDERSSADAS